MMKEQVAQMERLQNNAVQELQNTASIPGMP